MYSSSVLLHDERIRLHVVLTTYIHTSCSIQCMLRRGEREREITCSSPISAIKSHPHDPIGATIPPVNSTISLHLPQVTCPIPFPVPHNCQCPAAEQFWSGSHDPTLLLSRTSCSRTRQGTTCIECNAMRCDARRVRPMSIV
jgi:hypothetical protein